MLSRELVLSFGAFSVTCAGIWLVSQRVDSLLSPEGKTRIANWLRAPMGANALHVSTRIFITLFTLFLGKTAWSLGFLARSLLISSVWLIVLFSIFYINIPEPWQFRVVSFETLTLEFPEWSSRRWSYFAGVIIYDREAEYIMPVFAPITYLILSCLLSDLVALIGCHLMFKKLLASEVRWHVLLSPFVAIILTLLVSFVCILVSEVFVFLYVDRLSQYGLVSLLGEVLEIYEDVLHFPDRKPPFRLLFTLPLLSAGLTIAWMTLFVFSLLFSKAVVGLLRLEERIAPWFDVANKPFQVIGGLTIGVFTPVFWVVSLMNYGLNYLVG